MVNKERDLCIKAVRKDGLVLQFVHPDIIDEHICLEAIKQNGLAFIYIPKTLITLEMVTHYCLSKHCNLQLVPKHYLTETICTDAVKQDITNIAYMPKRFVTEEMAILALETHGSNLEYIPRRLWTPKVCNILVRMDNQIVGLRAPNIRYLPMEKRTRELCEIAYKLNKAALVHFPPKFATKELWKETVRELPHMFQHAVHRKRIRFVDQELCNIAIKANKWNIHHVPKKFQTKEMLMEYVKDALI
jgi:hypothetical protein